MYTSTETTEQRPTEFIKVYKNLEERSTIFSSVQAFFRNEYQPRLDDIASTFIEFIGRTVSQRTAVYYAFPYCVRILNIMRSWSRPPDYSLFFLLLLSSFYSSLEITLIFHHGHLSAFPPQKIFYLTSDLHRYVSATSVSICEEEEPRYAEPHY